MFQLDGVKYIIKKIRETWKLLLQFLLICSAKCDQKARTGQAACAIQKFVTTFCKKYRKTKYKYRKYYK